MASVAVLYVYNYELQVTLRQTVRSIAFLDGRTKSGAPIQMTRVFWKLSRKTKKSGHRRRGAGPMKPSG